MPNFLLHIQVPDRLLTLETSFMAKYRVQFGPYESQDTFLQCGDWL